MKEHFGVEFNEDIHLPFENADFSELDELYAGKNVYYGDYHCHAATGGSSDGRFSLENWKLGMSELKMDFAGIMDHRQVRHLYLDEFDPSCFLYGSEPLILFGDGSQGLHYIMIFPERDSLEKVLSKFPDVFGFTGSREEGPSFEYRAVERERFLTVVEAVKEEGGVFVHAHPKQVLQSEDFKDYYFGEGTVLETVYTYWYPGISNVHSMLNYKLWLDMLDYGYKVYTTATNDSHDMPKSFALNAVYSNKKWGPDFVEILKRGEVTAGYVAIKMSAGKTPMGQTAKYKEGMKLYLKVSDAHSARFDVKDGHRIEILSDKGVIHSEKLTIPYEIAFEVKKDRRFYRAVVIRESDGALVAISNPIWIEE